MRPDHVQVVENSANTFSLLGNDLRDKAQTMMVMHSAITDVAFVDEARHALGEGPAYDRSSADELCRRLEQANQQLLAAAHSYDSVAAQALQFATEMRELNTADQ